MNVDRRTHRITVRTCAVSGLILTFAMINFADKAALDAASVPAGRIYTVADIAADPHYRERGMLQETVMEDGSRLMVPGIVPKLSATPGAQRTNAPKLGEHTDEVLREIGLTEVQIAQLRDRKVIS